MWRMQRERGGGCSQWKPRRMRSVPLFRYWTELHQAVAEQHSIDLELVKIRCTSMSLPSNQQKALWKYNLGHQFLSLKKQYFGLESWGTREQVKLEGAYALLKGSTEKASIPSYYIQKCLGNIWHRKLSLGPHFFPRGKKKKKGCNRISI